MNVAYGEPFGLHPFNRHRDGTARTAPAHHQHFPTALALHLERRNILGNPEHLFGPQAAHLFMVLGIIADQTIFRFFQPADTMFKTRTAGNGQPASQRFRVTLIRHIILAVFDRLNRDIRKLRHLWNFPRFGTVGQIGVGKHHHRSPIFQRNANRLNDAIKTIRW